MRTRTLAAAITLLAPAVLAGQVSLATVPATPVRGALFLSLIHI